MSAPLKPPPSDLHDISLETVEVQVGSLYRISKHASGEPYFGRSAGNRFDDNSRPPSKRYGTCYLGLTLQVAIAETVLHDLMPMGGDGGVWGGETGKKDVVGVIGGGVELTKPRS